MNKNNELITPALLKEWNACRDGYKRFCELWPDGTDLKTAIDGLVEDGHDDWGYWLFDRCRDAGMYKEFVANGYRNSGDRNSGDLNSGYRNSGNWNSGDRNSGDLNSGDLNSGYRNSGNWNSGNWNSGYRNSGNWNSGNCNSGDRNSGNWNSGDLNSGFFNTITPDEIIVFNKPCKRTEWDKAYKPKFIYFDLTYWVDESDMTDEEKASDPNFHIRGGQLRKKDYKQAWKDSWDKADPEDRIKVKDLPNFDAEVFFKISGIDLR